MVRVSVTVKETLMIVGGVLLVDIIILTVWTAVDPLQWYRHSLSEDKFGAPLSSEGYCVSDSWAVFVSIIAVYHFALLSMASWMCYLSRDIPTKFSEGKYLSLAIISNMQVRQEHCSLCMIDCIADRHYQTQLSYHSCILPDLCDRSASASDSRDGFPNRYFCTDYCNLDERSRRRWVAFWKSYSNSAQ